MGKKTFASFSFGCRVNHAEREEIDRQMIMAGYDQVVDNPDIFIINTCSVTEKAEREARQLVYKTKRNNPETKIVVTGCSATYWLKTGMYKELPVEMVVDNVQKEYLVELIIKRLMSSSRRRGSEPRSPIRSGMTEELATDKFISSGRRVIKIQDGCHRFCSFCIVPHLRGLPKSRKIKDIIADIKTYNKRVSEIILTAINTEAFGKDTDETFLDLIKAVLAKTTIKRLSFGSVHPWSITDEFLEYCLANRNSIRLVNFFHIPLQSGSNKILTLMKRCHTREDMMSRVKKIAEINQNAFIATDIIVGYLEETDDDFQDTYDFLKESPISKFHVFRYSKRRMTAAHHMAKRLKEPTAKEKQERSEILRKLSEIKYKDFNERQIGRNSSVLVLRKNKSNYDALLDNQILITVQGQKLLEGSIHHVTVSDYRNGKLFGKILN